MKSNELNCGGLQGGGTGGRGGRLLRCVGSELEHVCGMCALCQKERVAEKKQAIAVGGDGLLSSSSSSSAFSFVMSLYFCT